MLFYWKKKGENCSTKLTEQNDNNRYVRFT